mmetsp:Transcript_36540/g.79621  ORF Transcript_36540/g.79621 Transcript_36540/m.79621 type:complete len:299 (-) Transcript_36540:1113-2009(-)
MTFMSYPRPPASTWFRQQRHVRMQLTVVAHSFCSTLPRMNMSHKRPRMPPDDPRHQHPIFMSRHTGGLVPGGSCVRLFACQLVVKAGQADGKGLQRRHGILVVHRERVLPHLSKLEDDVVLVVVRHELEVLHARQLDAPVEIQAVRLHLLVPLGGLVLHHREVLGDLALLVPLEDARLVLPLPEDVPLPAVVHLRDERRHLAWPPRAQHVVLIQHRPQLAADLELLVPVGLRLLRLDPLVVDGELRAHEVGAQLAEKVPALAGHVVLVEGDEVVGGLALLALARGEHEPLPLARLVPV